MVLSSFWLAKDRNTRISGGIGIGPQSPVWSILFFVFFFIRFVDSFVLPKKYQNKYQATCSKKKLNIKQPITVSVGYTVMSSF